MKGLAGLLALAMMGGNPAWHQDLQAMRLGASSKRGSSNTNRRLHNKRMARKRFVANKIAHKSRVANTKRRLA